MNIVDERNVYKQEIIGRKVEKTDEKSFNEVVISGKIVKLMECKEGVVMLVIKTRFDKHVNNIMTFIYPDNVNDILEKFEIDDIVRIKGNIQTKKRVYPDVTKYYQDLTLREIEKIERRKKEEE